MDLLLSILVWILLALGAFFSLTGGVGILRMPDFYSRLHPAGKNDTLGVLLIVAALLVETVRYSYGFFVAAKLVLIVFFIFMTTPAATHAITQAAWVDGLLPWKKGEPRR